jgi:hypothetical protein
MKIVKIIAWIVLGAFLLIQFIPVTFPETEEANENDLIRTNVVPVDVELILRTACYDCHSKETMYPWYSYVAPVKWLIIRDVNLGRDDLNFSEWGNLKSKDRIKLLDKISEEVEEGNMPLPIYTVAHQDASLSNEQREVLINWTEQMMNNILGE